MPWPPDKKLLPLFAKFNLNPTSFLSFFAHPSTPLILRTHLDSLAPSTAEDYIWRLHRFLSSFPSFPINPYSALLTHYKLLYPNVP